jgi:hypothetical protein
MVDHAQDEKGGDARDLKSGGEPAWAGKAGRLKA